MRPSYDADEAEQILERAAARTASGRAVSRERLLAMADELGISPEEVEAAAAEVEGERQDRELRAEFVAKRRAGFWAILVPFLSVNLMLFVINWLTGFGHPWFLYPLLGWSVGMASHAAAVLPTRGPAFEKEFAAWREQRIKREQQKARRRERRAAKREDKAAGEAAAAAEIAPVEERAGLREDRRVLRPTMSAGDAAEETPDVVRVGRSAGE